MATPKSEVLFVEDSGFVAPVVLGTIDDENKVITITDPYVFNRLAIKARAYELRRTDLEEGPAFEFSRPTGWRYVISGKMGTAFEKEHFWRYNKL
jgi:hypothetical protein